MLRGERDWKILALLFLALAPASGCTSPTTLSCTQKGCISGVHLERNVGDVGLNEVILVTACRNDMCNNGSVTVRKDPHSLHEGALSGPLDTLCYVSGYENSSDVRVQVEILSYAPFDEPELRDGDHYAISISHAGSVLAEVDETVTYERVYPNGRKCDKWPCLIAEL